MYEWAVRRLLVGICIYGQVIKKRREDQVVQVDRRLLLGTNEELEEALFQSEDSSTLNTSFIERHNLCIRQSSAYLSRRTPCHARRPEFLINHMALLMMYYNFVRVRMALNFGKTLKTTAMQAGLAQKRLSFRDIFAGQAVFFFVLIVIFGKLQQIVFQAVSVELQGKVIRSQQHLPREAPIFDNAVELLALVSCHASSVG